MKRITRAQLRGKPLDEDCRKIAKSDSGQFGPNDKRCFCTGIWSPMYEDYLEKCFHCTAWGANATPLNEGEEEYKNHLDIYG